MPATGPAKGNSRGGNASAQARKPVAAKPPSMDEYAKELIPVLEPYGWNEADIRNLISRCGNDKTQVQEAISNYLEEREGHEHGEWSNIDTKDVKKEKGAMAKERKAQKEKERAEEEEREKQRRQARIEEEKKRHLEMEARKEAMQALKKQPGAALKRGPAPTTTVNAWQRQEETPAEAVKEVVEASIDSAQANRSSSTPANAWGSTSQEEPHTEASKKSYEAPTAKAEEEDNHQEQVGEAEDYSEDHLDTPKGQETVIATENGSTSHPEVASATSEYARAEALRDFEMRLVQLEGSCNGDATRAEFRALWRCLARLLDQQSIAFGSVDHHGETQDETWTAPNTSSSSTAAASTRTGNAPETQPAGDDLDESPQAVPDSKGEAGESTTEDGKGKKSRSSRSKGDSKGEKGEKGEKGDKGDSKGGGNSDRRGKGKSWRSGERPKGKGKEKS